MRARLRIGIAAVAAALAFAPMPTLAQDNSVENEAASTPVGPRELEGFSLNGTVTREAEPQPTRTAPTPTEPAAERGPAPATSPAERAATPRAESPRPATAAPPEPAEPAAAPPPAASTFVPAPSAELPPQASATPSFSAPVTSAPVTSSPLPDEGGPNLLPWLLAFAAAAAAAIYWVWRQRSNREHQRYGAPALAFAGAPPPPAQERPPLAERRPPPPPPAAPKPQAPATSAGIVATRLRPWIDIEFTPTRCIVEDARAIIQFDVGMFNSGGAPARDVLLEMGIFNAGPTQDEEIARYQAKPPGGGKRVPVIEPLRRVERSSQISVGLDKLRVFEANGRRFFVPMLVLNAHYRWSGGEGRTSASFLVGRDSNGGEKMSPFRLDLGPRVFRGLGAREHHLRVRA